MLISGQKSTIIMLKHCNYMTRLRVQSSRVNIGPGLPKYSTMTPSVDGRVSIPVIVTTEPGQSETAIQ